MRLPLKSLSKFSLAVFCLVGLCNCVTAFGQETTLSSKQSVDKRKQSRIIIHATGLYNINNLGGDREFWTSTPKLRPALTVNNTFGYQLGGYYEFRNKRMITFSPGIIYGMQKLSYDNEFTFEHIDPSFVINQKSYSEHTRISSKYFGVSFALGYDYRLPKNERITLQGKVGIASMFLFNDIFDRTHLLVYYTKNDTIGGFHYADTDITRQKSPIGHPYYTFYLGGTYKTDNSIIKDVRIGLNFFRVMGFFDGIAHIGSYTNQYADPELNNVGGEAFYDRFRNVGLTIGLGF